MDDPIDEFSFLPAQAAQVGVDPPLPTGERVSTLLADGRVVSGLRWTPPGADAVPEVAFLHGAGLNAHTWDTTILALGRPALALDLPGHGDSSWRGDADYRARTLAPDVIRAIEEHGGGAQVLVGHSLGGLTAAAVAAARPDLVAHVVVVDITPGVDASAGPSRLSAFFAGPTDWATRDELVERALAFGLGGSRDAAARGVYFNSRVRDDGRVEWKHHFAHLAAAFAAAPEAARDAEARQQAAGPVLSESGWDDLASVRAPLTLVRADAGYVTADDAAEFTRRLPHADVRVVSAGHNVQEYIPAHLATLVAETL